MFIVYIASIIVIAITSAWMTAVVSTAIKNQAVQRQLRQLRYWQQRAIDAEQRATDLNRRSTS